jgi:sulfur relay (sulfurtransferase) complex TusBCD TusD component (DsrE family)
MPWTVPRTDILLKFLGAPHQTDVATTCLRLTTALLAGGARVQVWACCDATRLTWAGLGDAKPRNVADLDRDHPSAPRVVRDLLADHPDRLYWYVCRFCSDERGMADQIPQVRRRSPFTFVEHVAAADKTLALGVC